jgi:hypothetical protein
MLGPSAWRRFEQSSEVVVFGSMSAGLDMPDSDMDVLCIGGNEFKLKTDALDLIVTSAASTENGTWLESELASHVAKYGTWIKGSPSQWTRNVRVGPRAIAEKRRRVSAFMRALPGSWSKLEECFRAKYSTKLRREIQRLLLLERSVPIPPTRLLDYSWASMSKSPTELHERLRQLTSTPLSSFTNDLFARLDAHFRVSHPPM